MRYIAILVGVIIDLFVGLMVFGALAGGKFFSDLPIVVFLLLCGAGGTALIRSNVRKLRDARYQIEEKKILRVIKKLGGRVSAIEIATETDMTAKEADNCLRKLCINGYGEEQLATNDSVVYVFDGFLTEDERTNSKRLLDI